MIWIGWVLPHADDWWDVSKERVTQYVDRIEGSIKRLDDRG